MGSQTIEYEKDLERDLRQLKSWCDALAGEAASVLPQIREAVNAEKMTIPSCPARGSLGTMCLGQVTKKLSEVQAAVVRLEALLLDKGAPWNNRGDEKEWWKRED